MYIFRYMCVHFTRLCKYCSAAAAVYESIDFSLINRMRIMSIFLSFIEYVLCRIQYRTMVWYILLSVYYNPTYYGKMQS